MSEAAARVRIRRFLSGDGDALAAIYRRAVAGRAGAHYTQAQLEAWVSIAPSGEALSALCGDGRHAFVAIDAHARPLGFSDLEADGHIQFLYVDPAAAGRGVASGLLATVEAAARCDGLERLHAEASETALSVFLRAGFRRMHRRELSVGGVAIHNHAVEKRL